MPTQNSWNSNIPVEISKGGTNATSMTNTDGVVYYDGTKLETTAVGTAGQALTSNGSGAAPTFQDSPVSSSWVKLSSITASSSASVEFTSLISSTYKNYVVIFSNISSSGSDLNMSISSNNGTSYSSTNYQAGLLYAGYTSATFSSNNSTSMFKLATGLTVSGVYGNGIVWLNNFGFSAKPCIHGTGWATKGQLLLFGGENTTAATYDAIKFYSAGTITGTFTLYGIVQ